ncbi:MAG: hypothetical protein LBJ00_16885 [Planctomycetaceae bacterium]|nr:hypothetical protein [Planctomycetaceae bacterium]
MKRLFEGEVYRPCRFRYISKIFQQNFIATYGDSKYTSGLLAKRLVECPFHGLPPQRV